MKVKKNKERCSALSDEKGNVFFLILLGVVLFAALSFMVARGMRSHTSDMLTQRQIDLAVSEILGYSTNIEDGINKLRRKNISESDFCFAYSQFSALNNAAYNTVSTCGDDSQTLFHPEGGGLIYSNVAEDWLDSSHAADQGYGEWMFTNQNAVIGAGSGALNVASSLDLVAHINHLKEDICLAINKRLGISGIPDNGNAFAPTTPVNSGFGTPSGQINAADLSGHRSGCFYNTTGWNSYIFYKVLLERD